MWIENNFYHIISKEQKGEQSIYCIELHPDCSIYEGHFPEKPICPGVCMIEVIRECAALETGRQLLIQSIKQCRFINLISPEICKLLDVSLTLSPDGNGFGVKATVSDDQHMYVEYKGHMSI